MAAFQGHLNVAGGILVKVHPQAQKMEHVAGAFLYENLQRRQIVFIATRNQRVGNVQLIIVVGRVHHRGHAPLGQRAVGQGQLPLAYHKHPQGTRQVERRVKPCHAGTGDDDVILLLHVRSHPIWILFQGFSPRI